MREENTTPNDVATVSVAAKERLAKLLASENILIEHRNTPTAAFDVKNRVLVLPMWKEMSPALYDLLVGHEDGHALFTPFEGWHGACEGMSQGYRSFLNVIEDARIEKKVKRKFPGIRKSFIAGYKELLDRDFFGIAGKDVNSFSLIDRINIHFKGGSAMGVQFSSDEAVYVDRIAKAETWDDVVAIADDLWDEAKSEAETNPGHSNEPGQPGDSDADDDSDGEGASASGDDSDGEFGNPEDADSNDGDDGEDAPKGDTPTDTDGDDGDDGDATNPGSADDVNPKNDPDDTEGDDTKGAGNASGSDGDPDDTEGDDDDDTSSSGDKAGRGGPGVDHGEPFSETDKAFRENESQLVDDNPDLTEISYVGIPKDEAFDLDRLVVKPNVIHDALLWAASFSSGYASELPKRANAYKKANAKTVNYLAKEFEMRKAADASARATTARTGVLDTNTLHSFKWSDDVFKKVTTIPDGKSHGLVMFLDWSGSMSASMAGSIDQALNLALFCKKVSIPFDVYAFSDGLAGRTYESYDDDGNGNPSPHRVGPVFDTGVMSNRVKNGDLTLDDSYAQRFGLLNLLSSSLKIGDWNKSLQGMMVLRDAFDYTSEYHRSVAIPAWLHLHGTPLNETILSAIPVVNKFRKDNGLQIVNTVFLTDGEGGDLSNVHGGDRPVYGRSIVVRDPITRKEYRQKYTGYRRRGSDDHPGMSQMAILLDVLRTRTHSNVVNFYVTDSRPSRFKMDLMERAGNPSDWKCYHDNFRKNYGVRIEALYKAAKKDGGITIEDSALWDHEYLIMGGENLIADTDEGLDDELRGAAKGKLKSAFRKAATNKLKTRVVLRKFTELIAA